MPSNPGTRSAAQVMGCVVCLTLATLPLFGEIKLTVPRDPLAWRITMDTSRDPMPIREVLHEIATLLEVRIAFMSSTAQVLEKPIEVTLVGVPARTVISQLLGSIDKDLHLRQYDELYVVDYRTEEEKQARADERKARHEEIRKQVEAAREQSESARKRELESHPMLRRSPGYDSREKDRDEE